MECVLAMSDEVELEEEEVTADPPKRRWKPHLHPSQERPQGLLRGPKGAMKLNSKQEKFCHYRALGKTQRDAAIAAGYSGHGANASRLEGIPLVKDRIAELRRTYADKNLARIESEKAELENLIENEELNLAYFLKELRTNLTIARDEKDVKASNDCLKLMMELLGFLKSGGAARDKSANGPTDPRTPVKVSIINQLANGLQRSGGDVSTNGGAITSEPVPSTLPDLSDDDSELEPDFSELESAFRENAK